VVVRVSIVITTIVAFIVQKAVEVSTVAVVRAFVAVEV
jgi:hypothetical protein